MNIAYQIYVPSIINCLRYLIKLDIRNTSFCDNQKGILVHMKYLPSSLTHLGIYDCFIENIFEQIGKLIRLETLELSNINLINVPNQIGNLSSLSFLSLPSNKLIHIPSTIKNLHLLSKINLKNNRQLRSIQMLNGLKSLKILDVRHCSIDRLPLYLSQLTNLYMSNNYLINLVGIETLGYENNYKKYFYFDFNRIELIPTRIRYVKNLYWLNLNNNYLENLPKDIFNIMTLSYLYMQYNRFHHQQLEFIANKFKYNNPNLTLIYSNKSFM
ncbi:unnamed protein product [Rotaria magnacalcarata]|nr:unnamed protein product [Rotaria magnacalcarata]CAF4923103.1 unnamed protein product [Rotaria magnacalcarata]